MHLCMYMCTNHPTHANPCAGAIRTTQTMYDVQRPSQVSKRHAQSVKAVNGYYWGVHQPQDAHKTLLVSTLERATFMSLSTPGTDSCHQTDYIFGIYAKNWSRQAPPLGDMKTSPREIWGRETLQCTSACTYAQTIQPMQTLVRAPSAPCRPCLTFRDLQKLVNDMPKASKLSKITI
jgi:hypothetical protein